MQGQRTSSVLFLDSSWASEALRILTASSPPLKQGTIAQQFSQPRNQPWFLFILAWQVCSLAGTKSRPCPQDDTRPAPCSWLFIYSQAHLLEGSVSVWCSPPTDTDACVWLPCHPQLRKAWSPLFSPTSIAHWQESLLSPMMQMGRNCSNLWFDFG